MATKTLQLKKRHEYESMIQTGLPVFFGFFGEITCPKTPKMEPYFHKLAEEYKDHVKFVKISFDDLLSPVEDYIKSCSDYNPMNPIPIYPFFFQTFFNGKLIAQHQKTDNKKLSSMVNQIIDKIDEESNKITIPVKDVREINGHEIEDIIFNSSKPLLLHFHSNHPDCVIKNPKAFAARLYNDLQGTVNVVRIDTTEIDSQEAKLMKDLGVTTSPAFVSTFIKDGSIMPFRKFEPKVDKQEFNYGEMYADSCKLYEEHGAAMIEANKNQIEIKTVNKLSDIPIKLPVFIYTYNNNSSNEFKRAAQMHFKKLSKQYEGKINFLQVNTDDKVMPEVFRKGAQNFSGFFNKQIYGPIKIDENCIEEMNRIAEELSNAKPIHTTQILKEHDMKLVNKPIISFWYFPWDMNSLLRGVTFNKMYNDLVLQGKAQTFEWCHLDGYVAFSRHRISIEEVGSGCHSKENIEFFKKHPIGSYESDMPVGFKIDHNFPAFIGYSKGEVIGIVDSQTDESEVMGKFQKTIDKLKDVRPITIPEIDQLRDPYLLKIGQKEAADDTIKFWTSQGKPVLFFIDINDPNNKLNNVFEEIYDKVRGKVIFARVTCTRQINYEFAVEAPGVVACWGDKRIKKIDNPDRLTQMEWFEKNSKEINIVVDKMKKLAEKYPVKEEFEIEESKEVKKEVEDEVDHKELIMQYRETSIKPLSAIAPLNEKWLTKPGCPKIRFSIKDTDHQQFLNYETSMKSGRCRFGEEQDDFYIIKLPINQNSLQREHLYQICYSCKVPAINDKTESDRLDYYNCDWKHNGGSILRLIQVDEDCYYMLEHKTGTSSKNFKSSYSYNQFTSCGANDEKRIQWQFCIPLTALEKAGYEDDDDCWSDL